MIGPAGDDELDNAWLQLLRDESAVASLASLSGEYETERTPIAWEDGGPVVEFGWLPEGSYGMLQVFSNDGRHLAEFPVGPVNVQRGGSLRSALNIKKGPPLWSAWGGRARHRGGD